MTAESVVFCNGVMNLEEFNISNKVTYFTEKAYVRGFAGGAFSIRPLLYIEHS